VTRPRIDLLVFDGCPQAGPARDLVERVAADLASDADIEEVVVPDSESATRVRFLGSPSIRVDGRDVEPGADRRTDFVFGCRVYRTGAGLAGQPDEAWLRDALSRR
jgi:hypothetical protein